MWFNRSMTTNHLPEVFHVRCVEAEETPVSLGIYATKNAALRDLGEQIGADFHVSAFTWCDATGSDPDDNEFATAFAFALDEVGTNPEQVDAQGVIDFTNTVDEQGETLAIWWIERCPVKA